MPAAARPSRWRRWWEYFARPASCLVEDGVIEFIEPLVGVRVSELAPLTTILVWTRNSLYRLVVMDDSSISVQGGPLFPRPTAGQLEGARLGRWFVMTGWIRVGLLMELHVDGGLVTTSPVVAIATQPFMTKEARSRS